MKYFIIGATSWLLINIIVRRLIIKAKNRKLLKEQVDKDMGFFIETRDMSIIEVNALINERIENEGDREILKAKMRYLRSLHNI